MPDKRREKRRHIIYYLKIYNRQNDQLVGQLVDITTEGMKIVSANSIEKDVRLQLRMALPEPIENKTEISFDVTSLWCKRDVNPNFFSIGFKFDRISEDDEDIIKNLIYDFAFRD